MFSIYTNVGSTFSDDHITLQELVEIIKVPNDLVKRIRNLSHTYVATGDKTLKKTLGQLKSGLPYITAAGVFGGGRNNAGITKYSGVVQLDVDIKHPDGLGMVPEIKRRISALPYVSVCAISPSGFGIKALAHTDNVDPEAHANAVVQLCEIVEKLIEDVVAPVAGKVAGKIVDPCGKALSQPLYIPSDPDVHFNPDYAPWHFVFIEPKKELKTIKTWNGEIPERSNSHQEKILTRYVNRKKLVPGTQNALLLIGVANSFGIDREVLRNFMLAETWAFDDIDRIDYIYNKYADQHGQFAAEKIVEAPVPLVMEVLNEEVKQETFILEKNEYLSQKLDGRTITRNTHIVAPTGSGKTHLKFDGPQCWVFPTTSLCWQFFTKNPHARTVWGDAPNQNGDRNFVITTYDSCAKALAHLDVYKITLVLDEVHNFVVSSSQGYKLKALRSVLPFIPVAKKVITLTATPFYNEISEFQGFDTIIFKKKDAFKRNVQVLMSEESRKNDVARKIGERGNFSLVFLQTTDRTVLKSWENAVNAQGLEAVMINSQTKGSDEFENILLRNEIRQGSVYISTSVIAEGVSIETELEEVDVYIMGAHHPYLIEQMARRFRKIKTLNVFILTNSEESESVVQTLAQVEVIGMSYREELKSAAQLMVENYDGTGIKLSDFNIVNFPLYEDANGWQVDELMVENQTYQKICGIFTGNVNLVLEALVVDHGYELCEDLTGCESASMPITAPTVESEKLLLARKVALDVAFGLGGSVGDDEEMLEIFKKSNRSLRKILAALPGIKKLGREKFEEVMNDFDAWGDKASARFITYAKLLNSGIADRETYRNEVVKICLAEGRTSEELVKLGGMVFAVEYMSATDNQKMELVMSLMLGYDAERTTKEGKKIYVFSPLENRLRHDADIASLNLFAY